MSEHNDGGPAFPWGEHGTHLGGMTLRDYFAAKAMQGLMDAAMPASEIATEAYWMADAMLIAREAKQ